MGYLGTFFVISALVIMVLFWVFYAGRNKEKVVQSDKIYQASRRAVRLRQRLLRDPDYARRMRQKYSR